LQPNSHSWIANHITNKNETLILERSVFMLDSNLRLINKIKEKRGYLLPYHELFLCVDHKVLDTYDQFYENITLSSRHLDNKTKELVWFAILIGVQEKAGSLHVERGKKAGITDREFSEVLSLCQIAMGIDAVIFLEDNWAEHLPNVASWTIYRNLLEKVANGMKILPQTIELIFIGIYTSFPHLKDELLRFHLKRAKALGVRDAEICEAMSYVFIPCGANALIKASAILKKAIQDGEIVPDSDSSLHNWLD
jgi:alkylhydroperoxidase/carboxymuconolactone decarboxylase family protein YurZ